MAHSDGGVEVCPTCGRPLDAHDRHVRFKLPDPVLAVPDADRAARTWGNEVLMAVRDVGAFVRVLLPIRLTGGYTITVGCWLAVHPDDLRRAWDVWWKPQYADLRIDGYVANAIPPWDQATLAKAASAVVKDAEQVPYLVSSPDELLSRILEQQWPHEEILGVLDR